MRQTSFPVLLGLLAAVVVASSAASQTKVALNPNSPVAGLGKGTVYLARTDNDDLQYLQRYKQP